MFDVYDAQGEFVAVVDDGPHGLTDGDECPACQGISTGGDTKLVRLAVQNELGEDLDVLICHQCGLARDA